MNDSVVGQIVARHAEGYKVDIGSAVAAQLDHLAFEGANRKNKPNLQVGHLVYARVSFANKFTEPEIACFHPTTGKSAGFGLLEGGTMITVSLGVARYLLRPECELLLLLSHHLKYEVAIGMNGRVWINAESIKAAIVVSRCIESFNDSKSTDVSGLVRSIVKQVGP
ncbi:Exosome complex component rrp40 [Neolecta irregularis DAH-3]|uniref:Ribosomal RNA-processing protein 40 n=1 Tax=Neolecta irregularis (strain DAH-3) TaxID=1198029 RepID=A0A1U7LUW5_NEOID|nr:Exosome complex component rrp40 [Neolecta irregularis DAH-3]|eukprot:OLL26419.1 Exosome complex component rrp40 [Neolecta irregularis DAH-3]